jgi:hypothetical protein
MWTQADFDADGDVDRYDYLVLKANFGQSIATAAPAPDPDPTPAPSSDPTPATDPARATDSDPSASVTAPLQVDATVLPAAQTSQLATSSGNRQTPPAGAAVNHMLDLLAGLAADQRSRLRTGRSAGPIGPMSFDAMGFVPVRSAVMDVVGRLAPKVVFRPMPIVQAAAHRSPLAWVYCEPGE